MAIANYSDLKSAVGNYLGRSLNAAFQLRVPEFIQMGEARIRYGSAAPLECPAVRCRDMETSADITITDGAGTLPTRWLEFTRLYWPGTPNYRLTYIEPNRFWAEVDRLGTIPQHYTVEGGSIYVTPGASSGTLKTHYYQSYADLAENTDTNWLLTNVPAVYLQSALIEAFGYVRDRASQEAAALAYASAARAISDYMAKADASGTKLRVVGHMWR